MLAISPQDQAKNERLRERYQLPFPILADDNQAVIREWGLFNALDPKKRPIPYPASYIVGKDGRISWGRLGLTAQDRPSVGALLAAMRTAAAK